MAKKQYHAMNLTQATVLATHVERAVTFCTRLRGLLGRRSLEPGEGLQIEPCDGIHTFFMRFPIDVIFLDRSGVVLETREQLRPWRATRIVRGAHSVLELPAGMIRATSTRCGDRVRVDHISTIR